MVQHLRWGELVVKRNDSCECFRGTKPMTSVVAFTVILPRRRPGTPSGADKRWSDGQLG